jgi:hypothetical protein
VVDQAALLCPSFEIARQTLKSHAIDLNVKTIRRGANQERWRKSSRLKKFWTIPFENVRVS